VPDPPPTWRVPLVPSGPGAPALSHLEARFWADLPHQDLLDATDGAVPRWSTRARLATDGEHLYARFACRDPDPWGTYRERDDPLYEQEVVELFLAPGEATPTRYAEFEVSPRGVIFDAWVDNPTGEREHMVVDPGWDCPGLACRAGRLEDGEGWWAVMTIPLAPLVPAGTPLPATWRANLYRIERPRGAGSDEPEFSAWSPTYRQPADFHVPGRFGAFDLGTRR
jgi:hypothetical protein